MFDYQVMFGGGHVDKCPLQIFENIVVDIHPMFPLLLLFLSTLKKKKKKKKLRV
jgi:hypothetical protein